MKKPTETDLVRQCLDLLRLRGVPAWRANAGGGLRDGRPIKGNPAGTPDILAVLPPSGRLAGIECKMPGRKRRPAQEAWAERMGAAGALCLLIEDVRELEAALSRETS